MSVRIVNASIRDRWDAKVDVSGEVLVLSVGRPEPEPEIELSLIIYVESPDGVRESIDVPVKIPVILSSEYRDEWRKKIKIFLESIDTKPLVKWIEEAEKILRECRATVAKLGFSCSVLEDQLKSARNELDRLLLYLRKALDLASKGRYTESVNMILDLTKLCIDKKYQGAEACKSLDKTIRDILEKASKNLESLYNKNEYNEILVKVESLLKLCQLNIPGIGGSCGTIERVKSAAEGVLKLLNEMINLEVPENHTSRVFRGHVRISYNAGNETYKGIKVDFTPASSYIRVSPQPVVELPPLIPGSDFTLDITIESLVKGRIPIPYKVCHGSYCIQKIVYTNIGTPAAMARGPARSPGDYVGKSIYRLRSLGLETVRPRRLSRPLGIGEYTCHGVLGEGGFAVALLCSDEAGVNVVVKIPMEAYLRLLHGEDGVETLGEAFLKQHIEAFDREARILKRLSHPNIIRVTGHGVEPLPYIAFEFCEYGDLNMLLSRAGRLGVATALEIMIPVGAALAYGHSQNILHLDVKPSNILVTRELIPKLSDYNIAKTMATVSIASRKRLGEAGAHTPGFGAPEQVNPALPKVGPYSDVFSHAATLYYMITGAHPYPLDEWRRGLFRENPKPTPARKHNPEVPRELDLVLGEALSVHPHERPQNMMDYVNALIEIHATLP